LVPAKDYTYFMDDVNLLAIDEDHVDPTTWPAFELSIILSEAFFHAVQGVFPFILREDFLQRLLKFPRGTAHLSWSDRHWLATANLVWAVGSKWLHMCHLAAPGFCDHHLMYYARARALGIDHRVMFDHPDIGRVEAIGILAFYLMINGSVTR
jgi:hypothetical protein